MLVCNPHAGSGGRGRIVAIAEAARRWFGSVDLRVTEAAGHAIELAREADEEGCELVVAVGGDGTISEVVAGLLGEDGGREPSCALGVVAAGTGGDFARTLGTPRGVDDAIALLRDGEERCVDAMVVALRADDGQARRRVAINVVGFGLNGNVVRNLRRSRLLGASATYAAATARSWMSYRPPPAQVRWVGVDGVEGSWEGPLTAAFVGNGRFCGGGIDLGPEVRPDDGALDLLLVPKLSAFDTARGLRSLYRGKKARVEDVVQVQVHRVEAQVPRAWDVWVDCDGEAAGCLPMTLQVLPSRLRVRGAWRRPPALG